MFSLSALVRVIQPIWRLHPLVTRAVSNFTKSQHKQVVVVVVERCAE